MHLEALDLTRSEACILPRWRRVVSKPVALSTPVSGDVAPKHGKLIVSPRLAKALSGAPLREAGKRSSLVGS